MCVGKIARNWGYVLMYMISSSWITMKLGCLIHLLIFLIPLRMISKNSLNLIPRLLLALRFKTNLKFTANCVLLVGILISTNKIIWKSWLILRKKFQESSWKSTIMANINILYAQSLNLLCRNQFKLHVDIFLINFV